MTDKAGPDYQRVYDGIRGKISSGEYPVGDAIPSTPALEKLYDVSKTPVRQAVDLLKRQGVLEGHPGKNVYVIAMPEAAADAGADLKALGEQVAELAGLVAGDESLRERVERIETSLIEVYARLGWDYTALQHAGNSREASHEQAG